MTIIPLESSDKKIFYIDQEIISSCSETIRMALQGISDESGNDAIPLPKVDSLILEKVLIWATYHKNDGPVVEPTDDISPWDADFLKVDQGTLFDLILAANYLNIPGLLQLTCRAVADMIKDKLPQEIRETFALKNDFTPEEEEEARQMNLWWGEE